MLIFVRRYYIEVHCTRDYGLLRILFRVTSLAARNVTFFSPSKSCEYIFHSVFRCIYMFYNTFLVALPVPRLQSRARRRRKLNLISQILERSPFRPSFPFLLFFFIFRNILRKFVTALINFVNNLSHLLYACLNLIRHSK